MKAIIIDDEYHCIESINLLIKKYHPQVEVIAEITNPSQAIKTIHSKKPDLVFLDIKMPEMTGFELISKFDEIDFNIIFTTAYDEFAIKAFRVGALDYLLKPIDPNELNQAIKKVEKKKLQGLSSLQIKGLLNQVNHLLNAREKLSLPTNNGVSFIKIDDIIRCEADSNYTRVICFNKEHLVCKTLKELEELLKYADFQRIHHSHLINLKHIEKYHRGQGGFVLMTNGDHVDVSRSRKGEFIKNI